MSGFLSELKRRHIYRVAAAYAVVAWVLIQLVNNLTPMLHLPDWAGALLVVSLVVGFPVALLFAWIHQLAPESVALARVTTGKLDWLLIGALAVVIGIFVYQQLAAPGAKTAQQAGVTAARSAAASPKGAISVAVLPFVNLSSDKEQEFFSDGMTEEITAALAKVPDMRVVARTSAFEFKGKNVNIKTMGNELGATHLIEGSVRKAGNRVRITAQLIKADDGTHIWAEDYDRELTDVFAIQEDIARAITASLRMPLGLKPGENLVNNRAIDPESYEKYLRAKALVEAREGGATVDQEIISQDVRSMTEAVSLMDGVIARNPTYAPAWAALGGAYGVLANRNRDANNPNIADARALANELRAKGETALQKAIQLDPGQAEAYALLGWVIRSRANPLEAEALLKKALALDPLNTDALFTSGMLSAGAGRLKEALDFYEKGHAVDPFYPNLAQATAQLRWLNGQNDAAIALAKTLRPNQRATLLALIYASMGRYGEAADALTELAAGDPNSDAAQAARLLRMAPTKPGPGELAHLPGSLNDMFYLYLGAPDRALEAYERVAEIGVISANRANVWHPTYAPVRKTERFKALMRKVGLVDYWRAKGWPPQCHPTTGDDFACE